MLILDSPSYDPRFNIAAEEYLLKETDREYAFFYINKPSIIIGKHQNAWAEINIPWTRKNKIPVIRRISGGGTVWHDKGNLNFSFILNGEEGKLVNFREYALPVLEYLKQLGIPAEFGERNEILAGGLKISGNAEHVYRKRVLHHGTLLFSSDLSMLLESLDSIPGLYKDKAVQSVRSKTGNIREFLEKPMDVSGFRHQLIHYISEHFNDSESCTFSETEKNRVSELVHEKYSQWKWNFGYSPRYSFNREWNVAGAQVHSEIVVEKGRIVKCYLYTSGSDRTAIDDFLTQEIKNLDDLAIHITGENHDPGSLQEMISDRNLVKPEWIDIFVEGLL